MDKFTKADLKPGMIVELRNGDMYMIHEFNNELILVDSIYQLDLSIYNDNLTDNYDEDFDIVEVKKPNHKSHFIHNKWEHAPIIWERKELPKITGLEKISEVNE